MKKLNKVEFIETMVCHTIEKSGGVEKVEAALAAIREIPREEKADYVRRVVATDAGANQILALAMLGMTLGAEIYNDRSTD